MPCSVLDGHSTICFNKSYATNLLFRAILIPILIPINATKFSTHGMYSSQQPSHCPHAISSKMRRGGVFCKCNCFCCNCALARLFDTNSLHQESIRVDLITPSFLPFVVPAHRMASKNWHQICREQNRNQNSNFYCCSCCSDIHVVICGFSLSFQIAPNSEGAPKSCA